jgi:hypothetical protein
VSRRPRLRLFPAAAVLWALAPANAFAQAGDASPSVRAHHVTLSGGLVWTSGYSIGDATATLRGNAVGPTAPPFTLFRAQSSVDGSPGVDARVGFAITRTLTVEGGVSYQQPGITTELSGDAEVAAATIDAEQLSQYIVDIGVLWEVPRLKLGARGRSFVIGGGGYLRQLYDERTLVETGSVYYAGAGLRYWLRGGDGQPRAFGLRGDVRAMWRRGGVDFEGEVRAMPALRLAAFVEF